MVQELRLNADMSFSHNCLPHVFSVNLLCNHCVYKVTHFILIWRQPEACSSCQMVGGLSALCPEMQHRVWNL